MKLHILHHARLERIHGAALMRELARHGHEIGPGTLYPMLHGLEREGLLLSETHLQGGHQRREYRITPDGAQALSEARAMLHELADEVLHGEGPPTIRQAKVGENG